MISIFGFTLLSLFLSSYARTAVPKFHQKSASVVQSVTVGKFGPRNFTTVQEAIDWVPANNKQWVRIHVKPGTYKEKVNVPKDKQFIYLEGEGQGRASIEWDDYGGADNSSTFTLWADNFLASRITIKNTHDLGPGGANPVDVAPAILIWGDKAAFYGCRFYGVQDTLSDLAGRHFFQSCYIEGAVDFIWGNGQSLYEGCNIISTAANLGAGGLTGFVTAHGRERASDTSAFVFKGGSVDGKGLTYLGRAYRAYSTVIFYETYFGSVIVSLGWDAWHQSKQVEKVTIPQDKQFIFLEGEGQGATSIEWNDYGHSENSSTFTLYADNFLASHITFKGCKITSTAANLGPGRVIGFVTAQGRDEPHTSAFVFKGGSVDGQGLTYLGRAYKEYSTVIFSQTYFGSDIVPLGWDAWHDRGHESTITYVESGCTGPGSNMSGRVGWMKKLNAAELDKYLDPSKFIDQDGWIEAQPLHK
ncbi:hypothetical protein CDL15_Pgr021270 [Punica granatum]|uniref:Pectinesterase n=1 Tax=Punica granatum TaxID=22663 RepID=A0A218WQZ2_PUNGR|nr:hypothetical protein CDL15_Pgr021270 [Punica granatum]